MEVVKTARRHGLILMTAGSRESIRFLPPLNVSASEVEEGLDKFAAACQEVFDVRMIDRKLA
jgi:4-aminobutyrate aminotransferase